MIILLVRAGTRAHTIDPWLRAPDQRADDAVLEVMTIEQALSARKLPRATWIIADLDRYGTRERAFAQALVDRLREADPGVQILNEPRAFLGRHELLTRLHAQGLSPFRSHTLDQRQRINRWPVFLRMGSEHYVPDPTLLHDAEEVEQAVARVRRSRRRMRDFLLVEFMDTREDDGHYVKYAAFRIGDVMLAEHLSWSEDWLVKWATPTSQGEIDAEHDYLTKCDHLDQLGEVFDIAGIGFGRIDYSMHDGRPVIWEINTNPVLVDPWESYVPEILENRTIALQALRAGFKLIDRADDVGVIEMTGIPVATRIGGALDALGYVARFGASRWLRRRLRARPSATTCT